MKRIKLLTSLSPVNRQICSQIKVISNDSYLKTLRVQLRFSIYINSVKKVRRLRGNLYYRHQQINKFKMMVSVILFW